MQNPSLRALTILSSLIRTGRSPSSLRQTFETLGPTFVKLGQLISSRPDMFPREYTQEFRKLLDHGEVVPFQEVWQIIRKNLNKDPSEVFLSIDEVPISSASIGQVHKARLKNKKLVAIKVRRPGIKDLIDADTKILSSLTKLLNFIPSFKAGEMDKIIEEFSYWIENELDFRTETYHAQKLTANLKSYSYVEIPQVYEQYSTEEIMVSSYQEGITLNQIIDAMQAQNVTDPQNLKISLKTDYKLVTSRLLECYIFKQILEDGFFHGDPHPANIILLPDSRLAFVDFGIMGSLDQNEHREALMLILSLVDNDPRTLLKALATISEKTFTKRDELEIIDKLSKELHRIHGSDLEHATLMGELGMNIISLGRKYHLHWSPGVIDCLRAIALLEGAALRLVPHASMVELVKPHMRKFLAKQALKKFSEKELYKTVFDWMQLTEKIGSISDIIGDNGIKVETQGGETNVNKN